MTTQQIDLDAIANQTVSFTLDSQSFTVRVKQGYKTLYTDIYLDGDPLVLGSRGVLRHPIVYAYPSRTFIGNFYWYRPDYQLGDDDVLDYSDIGSSLFLWYTSDL